MAPETLNPKLQNPQVSCSPVQVDMPVPLQDSNFTEALRENAPHLELRVRGGLRHRA